jgi:hypothetical protein
MGQGACWNFPALPTLQLPCHLDFGPTTLLSCMGFNMEKTLLAENLTVGFCEVSENPSLMNRFPAPRVLAFWCRQRLSWPMLRAKIFKKLMLADLIFISMQGYLEIGPPAWRWRLARFL